MKEKHLREPFEKVGELNKCEIVRDPFSGYLNLLLVLNITGNREALVL